jgi:hypothetical protein
LTYSSDQDHAERDVAYQSLIKVWLAKDADKRPRYETPELRHALHVRDLDESICLL